MFIYYKIAIYSVFLLFLNCFFNNDACLVLYLYLKNMKYYCIWCFFNDNIVKYRLFYYF